MARIRPARNAATVCRVHRVRRAQVERAGADVMACAQALGQDLRHRPGARDGIERGHVVERHLGAVDPDAGDAALAAHDLAAFRPAHDDDHVAVAFGGAEQQHVGADEAGGDGDQVIGEVRHHLLGACGDGCGNTTARASSSAGRRHGEAGLPVAGSVMIPPRRSFRAGGAPERIEIGGGREQAEGDLDAHRQHQQREQAAQVLARQAAREP